MDEWYELWDKGTGNLVSDFPTLIEAIEHLAEVVAVNPGMDPDELTIFHCRDDGRIEVGE